MNILLAWGFKKCVQLMEKNVCTDIILDVFLHKLKVCDFEKFDVLVKSIFSQVNTYRDFKWIIMEIRGK